MSLASGSIDLKSVGTAAKTATNYLEFDYTNGLRISQAKDYTKPYIQVVNTEINIVKDATHKTTIDSNGMQIYAGSTASIASFGDTARIGFTNKSRVLIDYNSLKLIYGSESNPYVYLSDLRDLNGQVVTYDYFYVEEEENVTYPITKTFTMSHNLISLEDYQELSGKSFRPVIMTNNQVQVTNVEPGDEYVFGYITEDPIRIYTFGTRGSRDDFDIFGHNSFTAGEGCIAGGINTFAQGQETQALGIDSYAHGIGSIAKGAASHAEGKDTIASGNYSHAEGETAQSVGTSSHAEGYGTIASGSYAHAEGKSTEATGLYCHAEGDYTKARGGSYGLDGGYEYTPSHAEGLGCQAEGGHAEGVYSFALGTPSHAEGARCYANADASHAEGKNTTASGIASHAQNYWTRAMSDYQTAIGKFNIVDSNNVYAFIVGNGTDNSTSTRSNALTIDWNGNVNIASGAKYKINGTALSASDVGAVPTTRTVNSKALSSNISLTASDVGAVPTTRTVNSKALSSNISLTASDVSAVPTSDVSTTGGANKVIKSDSSGNVIITGSLTLGGHTTPIGSTLTATNSAQKSISADGSTTLATLSNLPVGTWVIECNIRFSNTANGIRRGGLLASGSSLGTSNMDFQVGAATTAAFVKQTFTKVITTTAITTYNLIGYSSVAVTVGAGEANIKAVRLC